jgi:hypothetical protein
MAVLKEIEEWAQAQDTPTHHKVVLAFGRRAGVGNTHDHSLRWLAKESVKSGNDAVSVRTLVNHLSCFEETGAICVVRRPVDRLRQVLLISRYRRLSNATASETGAARHGPRIRDGLRSGAEYGDQRRPGVRCRSGVRDGEHRPADRRVDLDAELAQLGAG